MQSALMFCMMVAVGLACTPKAETPPPTDSSSNKSLSDKMKEKTEKGQDDRNGTGDAGKTSVDPEVRQGKLEKIPQQTTLDLREDCHEFSDYSGKTSSFRFINIRVSWYTANGKSAPGGENSDAGGSATCSSTCGGSWRLFTEKEADGYTVPIDIIIDGKEIESGYGMESWTSSVASGNESDDDSDRVSAAYGFTFSYFKGKVQQTNPDALKYLLCRKS